MSNNHTNHAPPILLTIAGFDPSCGAGVAADLKTFVAHNCYGVAAENSIADRLRLIGTVAARRRSGCSSDQSIAFKEMMQCKTGELFEMHFFSWLHA